MSTLVVEVCKIDKVRQHPNADLLEITEVKGWQQVVKKGEFHEGDLVVLFPPDTVLSQEWTDRFGVTKYCQPVKYDEGKFRIRCAKLRGEPSFGLLVPATPDLTRDSDGICALEGDDVAHLFGAEKYIPPMKATAGDAESDHPLFVQYTDIESLRNFPDVFQPNEHVIAFEKVDGCLAYNVRVAMADGTFKQIINVEIGDQVLGIDQTGNIVPTLVTKTYNNGKADRWLTVKGKRLAAGRGNHYWVVHCTPNHRFYSPDTGCYHEAQTLQKGNKVLLIRNELGLTPLQEQVILGKLLGDGYFHDTPTGAAVEFSQKTEHSDYVDWVQRGLGDLGSDYRDHRTSGYGTEMLRSRSIFNPHIKEAFQDFADQKVPVWVTEHLGPIALAFWYMDDGSLAHNDGQEDRANITTGDWNDQDCSRALDALRQLGIEGTYFFSEGHSAIRFDSDNSERLFLTVAPYVPPVMQYKLPERYRGHTGWLPSLKNQYKPMLVPQVIDEVFENETIESAKWDIETETHNFFANNILVHNSNVRLGLIEGVKMAGSHRLRRKEPEDYRTSIYWAPWLMPGVTELMEGLAKDHKVVILFGETFGPGIQSLQYDLKKPSFLAFDLYLDGRYVDVEEFFELTGEYGVRIVPEIRRCCYSVDRIREIAGGKSLIARHIKEGVVVRPVHERTDPRVGRCILKWKSDEYLLGQKEDFTDV
jgi:hypothetical protein